MTDDPASWLVGEVSDLLDAGSVGLYEFLWLLRGTFQDLADAELRAYATQALERLQLEGVGRLVWLLWPGEDAVDGAPVVVPGPDNWSDPVEGEPYLAFSRN